MMICGVSENLIEIIMVVTNKDLRPSMTEILILIFLILFFKKNLSKNERAVAKINKLGSWCFENITVLVLRQQLTIYYHI